MPAVQRPISFVLAASNHGTMIVSRHDYHMTGPTIGYGVGYQILQNSSFDPVEIDLAVLLLRLRQYHNGDGVVGLDCGANIGVHTVEWARAMTGWGEVLAFEAQERIFYALAGNIAINNCMNAGARNVALGASCGSIDIPVPDYLVPSSFGSLELRKLEKTEYIGQSIDYSEGRLRSVEMISIDSLNLRRVDFIKVDVEGMELEVLAGAAETIKRCRPLMLIETLKSDRAALDDVLVLAGYRIMDIGINLIAVHNTDPLCGSISVDNGVITIV